MEFENQTASWLGFPCVYVCVCVCVCVLCMCVIKGEMVLIAAGEQNECIIQGRLLVQQCVFK